MELDLSNLWAEYQPTIIAFGIRILGALAVLVVGLRVSKWLSSFIRKQVEARQNIDATLGSFFASLVNWAMNAAVFITVLSVFGVEATSFVAIIGALSLAIGLAMQGALGNIASGVMIMIFRPYKLDDYIEAAGAQGTVKDINLFQTVIATADNIKVMIPNSEAISGVISNYSGYTTRRVDITFGIDYDDDMNRAIEIIQDVISKDARILSSPKPPFVKVVNLGASSVDIASRTWVNASDYWDVKFDLTKAVKARFDKEGVSIPYPHTMMIEKKAD